MGLFFGNQIQITIIPEVFVAVRHEQHALGVQSLDGTLIVGDEHDCSSYLAMAFKISSREAGSRLLVGSSSSSTLAREVTSVAKARRVFSPPDST